MGPSSKALGTARSDLGFDFPSDTLIILFLVSAERNVKRLERTNRELVSFSYASAVLVKNKFDFA